MTTNVHVERETAELFRAHQDAKMLINLVMKDAFINFYPGRAGATLDDKAVSVLMALGIAFKKVPDAIACVNPREWRKGEQEGFLAVRVFGVFWDDLVRRTLEASLLRMGYMRLPDPAPEVNEAMGGVVLNTRHSNTMRWRFSPCPPTMDVTRCTKMGMAFMSELRRKKVRPVNVAVESLDGGTLLSSPASTQAHKEKTFTINAGPAVHLDRPFAVKAGSAALNEKTFAFNAGPGRIEEKGFVLEKTDGPAATAQILSSPATRPEPLEKDFEVKAGKTRIEEKGFAIAAPGAPREKVFSMKDGSAKITERGFQFTVPRLGNLFKGKSKANVVEDFEDIARLTVEVCELLDRSRHAPEHEFVGAWNGFLARPVPVLPVEGLPDDPDFADMCREAAMENLLTTLCPGDAVLCEGPVEEPKRAKSPERPSAVHQTAPAPRLVTRPEDALPSTDSPKRPQAAFQASAPQADGLARSVAQRTFPASDGHFGHAASPDVSAPREIPTLRPMDPAAMHQARLANCPTREVLNEFLDWEDQLPPEAFETESCEDATIILEAKRDFLHRRTAPARR